MYPSRYSHQPNTKWVQRGEPPVAAHTYQIVVMPACVVQEVISVVLLCCIVSLRRRWRGETDCGQASRAISTARLRMLPCFDLPPINVIVSHGPSGSFKLRECSSWSGLPT